MSVSQDGKPPVVEPVAECTGSDRLKQSLDRRIRQREILSQLGVIALQGGTVDALLTETMRLVADGLPAEFCKVLEFEPGNNCFTVRAGVGWGPDVVTSRGKQCLDIY